MSSPHPFMHTSRGLLGALAAAGALLLAASTPAAAQQVTMETLLDRINIEDLLVRYYYDLASGKAHEMSEYFTEDAMLDVDGTIAKGRAEIEKLYGGGRARDPNAAPRPHNGMLLTNPVIEIKGNKAQAHVIWTGVSNKGVGQAPSLYEQGREDSELVKVN
ncbi:MAG TPA: nuclear transport factor 2 family protein, partial [Gammaproteobacteria bacterium]|nr:nuclear transport factor 2 family protein [Gammaproteobacteria bacterium]